MNRERRRRGLSRLAWSNVIGRSFAGVRMTQPFHAARPRAGKRRHFEDGSARRALQFDRFERRLLFQCQASLDRRADPFGRQMEISLRFLKALVQFCDALFELTFGADVPLRLRRPSLGLSGIQFASGALDQTRPSAAR